MNNFDYKMILRNQFGCIVKFQTIIFLFKTRKEAVADIKGARGGQEGGKRGEEGGKCPQLPSSRQIVGKTSRPKTKIHVLLIRKKFLSELKFSCKLFPNAKHTP